MKKLRVVGTSADSAELVLSNKPKGRTGTHSVTIDKRLLTVLQKAVYARRQAAADEIEDDTPETPPARPSVDPRIPPREIQRLLRAGHSPVQVAREAEVDVAYVEQFFQMVIYERAGIIADAHAVHQEKARLGTSGLPLGEAVLANLAIRRVRMSDDEWQDSWMATRHEGQPWTVSFTFPFRGRKRKATWKYDPRERTLTTSNKIAQDMGWVQDTGRPIESSRAVVVTVGPGSKTAKKKRAPAKRAAPKGTAAKKKPAKRAAAKRPTARKPAKRAPARKPAKRAPAKRSAAKKRAPARKRR